MFSTVKRIIAWCGDFKGDLFLGFVFSFFSSWMVAAPIAYAGFTIAEIVEIKKAGESIPSNLWLKCLGVIVGLTIGRFLFDYLKARFHEKIGYLLIARDRIKIGEALKRVSLGYFQTNDTGAILNAITTGLHTLENMGIRMVDNFVGGYLNFICILIFLGVMCPKEALIAVFGVVVSFLFLSMISYHSSKNTKVLNAENERLTQAALEYTRGLPVVKSFGMEGASIASFRDAVASAKRIALKIECGFIPYNCLHLFALKAASAWMVISVMYAGIAGDMELKFVIVVAFLSMSIFGSVEPIADSAHVLAVINNALDKLNEISEGSLLDERGTDIKPERFDIEFENVDFSYDNKRQILKDVSFKLPEGSTTAIVGHSGSGKTTICNLIARFYDTSSGSISLGGHKLTEFTCDSLLSNISMVFQNVYLF
nr:ABC transporter ATP-binding protein/permease [Eubacterium sp.]